jgi:hypothetical protein
VQTVHVNEDVPCGSLAATGTRFQRQIGTARLSSKRSQSLVPSVSQSQTVQLSKRPRSVSLGSQNGFSNTFELPSPDISIRRKSITDYWTGAPQPTRPKSRVSSRNSSLHGYEVFDPQEQNMSPTTIPRPSSGHSLGRSPGAFSPKRTPSPIRWLPPPPIQLGTVASFECDICGETVKVRKKRLWKSVQKSSLIGTY